MKEEKVVFLVRNVAPEKYGGGETYQLELGKLLKKNGFKPVIISASTKLLEMAEKNEIQGLRAPYSERQNWSGWRNILLPLYLLWQFRLYRWYKKMIRQYKPVVANIQSRDDWIAGTLACSKKGVRVLWTDHMDFRSWVLENVNVKGKNLIGKWILKVAKLPYRIVMISKFERDFFVRQVKKRQIAKVIVARNGSFDRIDDFTNTKTKKKTFIYLGRIVDYKGISELIESFRRIDEEFKGVSLAVYGDGPDFNRYKKQASNLSNVKFYGRTDKPLEKIATCEIFVLPSHLEGLSLSLLDAMMMKKKIIVSDTGGNPEAIRDGKDGIVFRATSVDGLYGAMKKMLTDDKLAEEMAENARIRFEEEFDFEKNFAKKMLPLYNKTN